MGSKPTNSLDRLLSVPPFIKPAGMFYKYRPFNLLKWRICPLLENNVSHYKHGTQCPWFSYSLEKQTLLR